MTTTTAEPMTDLQRRAMAAWLRSGEHIKAEPPTPPAVVEHEGKTYVVISWEDMTLAVYRVRTSGQLKALKRWPMEVVRGSRRSLQRTERTELAVPLDHDMAKLAKVSTYDIARTIARLLTELESRGRVAIVRDPSPMAHYFLPIGKGLELHRCGSCGCGADYGLTDVDGPCDSDFADDEHNLRYPFWTISADSDGVFDVAGCEYGS